MADCNTLHLKCIVSNQWFVKTELYANFVEESACFDC